MLKRSQHLLINYLRNLDPHYIYQMSQISNLLRLKYQFLPGECLIACSMSDILDHSMIIMSKRLVIEFVESSHQFFFLLIIVAFEKI